MGLTKLLFGRAQCLLLIVVAVMLCFGRGRAVGSQEVSGDGIRIVKLKVVERINADRKKKGLQPVLYFEELSRLADDHCGEMLELNYLSHWNRTGVKPYMRYSLGGIADHTAENVGRIVDGKFSPSSLDSLEAQMMQIHENFASEQPSSDQHRWTLLDPHHTHAGIGLAFDQKRVIMIEVFASRYVTLTKPLPSHAKISQKLSIAGSISVKGFEIMGITIFYDPLPSERPLADLQSLMGYGFPKEELLLRPILPPLSRYGDGSTGTLETNGSTFRCAVPFFRDRPGVYTVVVWVRGSRSMEPFFMATHACVFVEEDKADKN
jgi:hypothetical protein